MEKPISQIQTERQEALASSLTQAYAAQKTAEKKGQWTDDLFPPDESSLFSGLTEFSQYSKEIPKFVQEQQKNKTLNNLNLRDQNKKYVWVRLSEMYNYKDLNIVKEPKDSKEAVDLVQDVIQGELGDCYFLSCLDALATSPERIKQLLGTKSANSTGAYEIRLFLHGEPISIMVDDYVPCKVVGEDEAQIAFARLNNSSMNIWPILLEKAWAKLNLNYENIIEGNCSDAFEVLSPAPITTLYHTVHKDCIFEDITAALQKGYIVCTDITLPNARSKGLKQLQEMGLITNHAYTVLRTGVVYDLQGTRVELLQVRNPWGSNEWQGDWSDSSTKWTPEAKKLLNFQAKDDGIFWISKDDFCRFYTTTHILGVRDGFNFASKKFVFDKSHSHNIVKVNVTRSTNGSFILNQKNQRVYRNSKPGHADFTNHYASMVVFRRELDGSFSAVGSVAGSRDRLHVDLEDIPKGEYYIAVSFPHPASLKDLEAHDRIHGHLEQERFTYRVGLYSSLAFADFEKVSEVEQGQFKNFMVDYSIDLARRNKEAVETYGEDGEPGSWKASYFPKEGSGYGYIVYENNSDGTIHENLTFTELYGVNLIPTFQQGDIVTVGDMIAASEEKHERETYERLDKVVRNEVGSSVNVVRSGRDDEPVSRRRPLQLRLNIGPHSRGVLLMEKYDDNAGVELESENTISYPVHNILSERKFPAVKQRVKYLGHPVEIYETIIEHNSGVLIRYRNRTQLTFGVHLRFSELFNLHISINSDELREAETFDQEQENQGQQVGQVEVKTEVKTGEDGEETEVVLESKVEKLEEDEKAVNELEELEENAFDLRVSNKNKEAVLNIAPDEVKFIHLKANDVFESYSYSMEATYHLNLTKPKFKDVFNAMKITKFGKL